MTEVRHESAEVAVMQQNLHRKSLANHIRLSTSTPLILTKPGPSQGQKPPFKLTTSPDIS